MQPRKWKQIKLEAARRARITLDNGGAAAVLAAMTRGSTDWRTELTALQQQVWTVIDNWDIRRVRALCALFPGIVPRDCMFICELNDRGDWIVY